MSFVRSLFSETSPPQLLRAILGGALMGLANLVPGISGGTMLLAAGVYPLFISGIAEITTFRLRAPTIVLLGAIAASAGLAIITLAGAVKALVIGQRWVMYSLFIGLTLGGVPVVWRLLKRFTLPAGVGTLFGIAVMALTVMMRPGEAGDTPGGPLVMLLAGIAGASAMILPGISGSYLWLILGVYLNVLTAIEQLKAGLLGALRQGAGWTPLIEPLTLLIPLGIGVVLGIVGISNLIRMLLARFEKATLGVLLGLLLGAVLGLWPFQQGVAPLPGSIIKGRAMTAEAIAAVDPKDYPLERFDPSGGQVAGALALVLAGFAITQAVAWVGHDRDAESN
jgi:putative membrane protein